MLSASSMANAAALARLAEPAGLATRAMQAVLKGARWLTQQPTTLHLRTAPHHHGLHVMTSAWWSEVPTELRTNTVWAGRKQP